MAIRYYDFDLLIESSGDRFKARVLDSPAGEATVQFKIPFTNTDVENFYTQIGHTRLVESSQMQKMRGFGQQLFDAVITGDVRDKFRESLAEVSSKRNGLRIRLRLADVPELVNMPWEFMYDTSLSRFLTLSIETPLVRYLDVPRDIQPLTVRPPLKILAVISSPRNFPALNVQREWDNLQEAIKRLETHSLVQLTRLEKPTLQALQRQLRRGEYHIFHFIGHGIFSKHYQDGQLLFENEIKGGDPVSSRDLGILLHDHRQLRLAVLNACEGARTSMEDQFSGTAQSLIQQGLPAVIAMQFRITDIAAITLAREFYAALADGYPVDAALTEARKSIKTHGNELEWGTPVLFMRSPNGQIFDVESINQTSFPEFRTETFVDSETEKQVSHLYTEGLEAFYLKEWETAVTKFKSILAIQSNHKDAASKLKIAQHQQKLSNFDQQAQSAESKGEWASAIRALEALAKEFPNQASFASRLDNARKQLRMDNLYSEAQQLFKAEKWLAVVQVFREINSFDASYPDPDHLLSRAKDEAAAQKLQSELESLYQTALEAIDASNWQIAQDKLRTIHSKESKYRQTDKLLQRVESEIERIEKKKQEDEQVKSLYVQAENLAARKQWNKSLEKIEEILIIQPNFDDPKQIANRASQELEKIQEESEKQEYLAKLYAEAVAFNQAGEYQSALDKWNQIRSSDTSYPDRQRVRATAQKMLKKSTEPERITRKIYKNCVNFVYALIPADTKERQKILIEQAPLEEKSIDEVTHPSEPEQQNRFTGYIYQIRGALNSIWIKTTVLAIGTFLIIFFIVLKLLAQSSPAQIRYFTSNRSGKSEIFMLIDDDVLQVTQTKDPAESWSPDVSSNGILYFTSNRSGKAEIYMLFNDKVSRVTQTSGGGESWSPIISPDGTLYFTSDRTGKAEIYMLFDDKVSRVTQTSGGGESWSPNISPDGILYFTSDRTGKAEIYMLADKKVSQVTQTRDPAKSWSPAITSGGILYFTSDRTGKAEIYMLVDDKVSRLTQTNGTAESWSPIISSDGILYFTSNRTGKAEIHMLIDDKVLQVTQTVGSAESWMGLKKP